MAYSFTEKKRIRKNFGKLPDVMDLPYLLAIQLDSYKNFTQTGVKVEDRMNTGLHAALNSIFPIVGYSGHAALEYVDYVLGKPAFDVEECKLRGVTFSVLLEFAFALLFTTKSRLTKQLKIFESKKSIWVKSR